MTLLKAFIGEVTLWMEIVLCFCLFLIGCLLAAMAVLAMALLGVRIDVIVYTALGFCIAPLTIRFLAVTGRDLVDAFRIGYKKGFRRD